MCTRSLGQSRITFASCPMSSTSRILVSSFTPHRALQSHHKVYLGFSKRVASSCRFRCTVAEAHVEKSTLVGQRRSPSDLIVFRRSRFAAHLNELRRRNCLPEGFKRDEPSPLSKALITAGRLQEERVLKLLREKFGLEVVSIPFGSREEVLSKTRELVRKRTQVIHQAAVGDEKMFGYVDVLIRDDVNPFIDGKKGDGSYSVCEIKLASVEKGDYAIQAATYANLVNPLLQNEGLDETKHVLLWLGKDTESPVAFRVNDVQCFYKNLRRNFDRFVSNFDENAPLPPMPLDDCSPWNEVRDEILTKQDSLLKIAGMRVSQANALKNHLGLSTMRDFATYSGRGSAPQLGRHVFSRLQRQAALQVATEDASPSKPPSYRVIDTEESGWGLNRLPSLVGGDIYFDMEGFPLGEDGGLEYLFGASTYHEHLEKDRLERRVSRSKDKGVIRDDLTFHAWWAHDPSAEEAAFVSFIDFVADRVEHSLSETSIHVYHYGHYEVSALRRLAARAETADGLRAGDILEDLIRKGTFVDIYEIVRGGLQIGTPNYSIKQVEKLAGINRSGDECADAQNSVALYHEWRVLGQVQDHGEERENRARAKILVDIKSYNKQDCESLEAVVSWLRQLARENDIKYIGNVQVVEEISDDPDENEADKLDLPPGTCGRTPEAKLADSAVISAAGNLSKDLLRLVNHKADEGESSVKRSMAALLGYHVREGGPARARFAERVRLAHTGDNERVWRADMMADVRLENILPPRGPRSKRPQARFRYDPSQPCGLSPLESGTLVARSSSSGTEGEASWIRGFLTVKYVGDGTITATIGKQFIDPDTGEADVPSSGVLVSCDGLGYCPAVLRQSILNNFQHLASGPEDITKKLMSNYLGREGIGMQKDITRGNFMRTVSNLQNQVIAVQGPPGSGKTRLMSEVIKQLVVDEGKTVAVCSNSHAAIDNLLLRSIQSGVPSEQVAKVGAAMSKESLAVHNFGAVCTKSNIGSVKVAGLSLDTVDSNETKGNGKKVSKRAKAFSVVGATAYALAAPSARLQFDYLFVDEAGQVPLANFIATLSCAKSALLVGDQQQLEMPIQGLHPSGVGRSCLSYLVGQNVAIVSPRLGLFLDSSYRMTPQLCSFISHNIYDGVLKAHQCTFDNRVKFPSRKQSERNLIKADRGLVFISREQYETVSTASNMLYSEKEYTWSSPWGFDMEPKEEPVASLPASSRHSLVEVSIIEDVVESLLEATYVSAEDEEKPMTARDILVVAPYNLQVRQLRDALHSRFGKGLRVGTVDKFQGQEAAVAIVSVCGTKDDEVNSSDDRSFADEYEVPLEDDSDSQVSKRGPEFVLRRNRLNVAMSRAQCLAIVVGSEKLAGRSPGSKWGRTLDEVKMMSFYAGLIEAGLKNNSMKRSDSRPYE